MQLNMILGKEAVTMYKLLRGKLKIFTTMSIIMIMMVSTVWAIEGIYHEPYGIDGLYTIQSTERFPRDPIAGEDVYIKITTWPVESGQATWIEWHKNGQIQSNIGGNWKYNEDNNTYWEANMGSLSKGDNISYTVHGNRNGSNEKVAGPYTFTVTDWEYISSVSGYTDNTNAIELLGTANIGTFSPKINISFVADDVFRVQMSPKGNGTFATGLNNYSITNNTSDIKIETSKLVIKIDKNPYRMHVYEADGITLIAEEYSSTINRNMAWLTDGDMIIDKVEDYFYTPTNEGFFGFGEHYNNFNKRGQDIDTYVYNQYKNQDDKTYMAIPFMLNSNGYGLYVNSTYYSQFKIATKRTDMYSFTIDTGGKSDAMLDYYFIGGNDLEDVVCNYSDITGRPTLPPKESFGVWMSANEWDRESEVQNALTQCANNDIPASVIVLEQWSDEKTFYIFNDATYTAVTGADSLDYNDFTFNGRWPDPVGLVDDIHSADMKVLLWQVPLLKYTDTSYEQNDNDRSYMETANYAVGDGSGGGYKIPNDKWFSGSYLLDFTNQNAINWWMSKRAYLFDGLGIDGFKTDGGEMVWGRWNTFSNGAYGDEMRNTYPNEYIEAYYDFTETKVVDPIIFSRSGTAGVQEKGVFWSGDQESTFYAYDQAIVAGLTANMSGVPFIGWDLAGFTGSFPTTELYKRSAQQQAFGPIMQFHSEKSNPSISEERSPWNVASRNNDLSALTVFTEYANKRYNLLPYIYSEAKKATTIGVPLMRAMVLEAPEDINTYDIKDQYMFGEYLLVAPIVVEGQTTKSIYLPEGEWYDIVHGGIKPGGRTINYYADENSMPVFAKSGAILPMNLNADYIFGGTIGNDMTTYNNLTFRVYPDETSHYVWFDDIGSGMDQTIICVEEYDIDKVTISLPPTTVTTSLQVFTSWPSNVKVGTSLLTEYDSLSAFKTAITGWYYDTQSLLTYIKVDSSTNTRDIVLEGVNKASYEAEFATLSNTETNNNHSGYTGTGFVDGFETQGDTVTFDVYVESVGVYAVDFKYCAGSYNASRSIYVNSTQVAELYMDKTANWDTWAVETINMTLVQGHNTIQVSFDSDNYTGVNIDHIVINE